MNIVEQNEVIYMIHPDLSTAPQFNLNSNFSIRSYQIGDETHWISIHEAADLLNTVDMKRFRKTFGHDSGELSKRQLYLLDRHANPIGTASAWFDHDFQNETIGLVHWVAIHPDFQGQGLAKPLLSSVCKRLVELGHDQAYLKTSTARVTAINLYWDFGFRPVIKSKKDALIWSQIKAHLKASY
jgi:ribosomal protein S18 acetylase RimI-like enzyme